MEIISLLACLLFVVLWRCGGEGWVGKGGGRDWNSSDLQSLKNH